MGDGLRERLASQHAQSALIRFVLFPGLIVAGLALIVLGILITRRRRMHHERRDTELPPLVFPLRSGTPPARRVPPARVSPGRHRVDGPPPRSRAPANGSPPDVAGVQYTERADPTAGETIRLQRPLDDALQLLPGRLQIVEGTHRGQDIRFIRTPGQIPSITIGREHGPPDRHVQLDAATVSRLHARMQFEDGRWRISNLSRTNPLVLNGEELPVTAGSRLLDEGDRIEIGEVVLRFRER